MAALALMHRLACDRRGGAMIEFALAAPVICMTLLGLFDLSYNIYAKAMLEGAIQKAARDSAIEGASDTTIDTRVRDAVHIVVPSATLAFQRRNYSNFADISRPEDFTDLNNDGACNDGEPYEDANGNGTWDMDRGRNGQGGARDAVMYDVTVRYDRAFPLAGLLGFDPQVTVQSKMVLRNQPYGPQDNPSGGILNCN